MHRAQGNPTDRMREVMTVIYVADGARVIEPDNPDGRLALETDLRGLQPGDLVAGPLHPLVYTREEGGAEP
jgi:hypothetical protein